MLDLNEAQFRAWMGPDAWVRLATELPAFGIWTVYGVFRTMLGLQRRSSGASAQPGTSSDGNLQSRVSARAF